MIYDDASQKRESIKIAKKPSRRPVISRKVQRLKTFAEIPDFEGKSIQPPTVAQPSWLRGRWASARRLSRRRHRFSSTARFTSCFSYIYLYSANRRVRNHVTPFLRKILGLNWL